jgi:hydroxymethylbilane synthase
MRLKHDIVLGTRDSALALWQAHQVQAWLQARATACAEPFTVRLSTTKTLGDKILDRPFHAFEPDIMARAGGMTGGVFVKELEQYLLTNVEAARITLAVHSMKDVPSKLVAGTFLMPFGTREDVRDVWVFPKNTPPQAVLSASEGQVLSALPRGTRVGSSGLRRVAQVLSRRSDVSCVPIRGNLQTRLQKLDAGEADVLLLAMAGLKRLGLYPSEARLIIPACPVEELVPAPAQGMLALQGRSGEREALYDLFEGACDAQTFTQIWIERTLLELIEGGCQTPLGVYVTACPRDEAVSNVLSWRVRVFYAAPLVTGETLDAYRTAKQPRYIEDTLQLPCVTDTMPWQVRFALLEEHRQRLAHWVSRAI